MTDSILKKKTLGEASKGAIAKQLTEALQTALACTGVLPLLREDDRKALAKGGFVGEWTHGAEDGADKEGTVSVFVKDTLYFAASLSFSVEVSMQFHSGSRTTDGYPRVDIGTPGSSYPLDSARTLSDVLGRVVGAGAIYRELATAVLDRWSRPSGLGDDTADHLK